MITLEIIATISGLIAVTLQAKEKITAWPFAIVSVTISAYIFFLSKLYSDFGLHIIYIFLNIYGWYIWSSARGSLEVTSTIFLKGKGLFMAVLIIIFGTVILGALMSKFTDAELVYFDAFTTSGSLVAQYLLAKKYLENWLFWIVVDVIAIPVYLYKELYFFSFLFFVYLLICIWGYMTWKKRMKPILS